MHARAHIDAVAGVIADPVRRDAAQRVVQQLDTGARPSAALGEVDPGVHRPMARELRIIDLQDEAGIDDRPVFRVQRVGNGDAELFVGFVIFVGIPIGEIARGHRGHEDFGRRDAPELAAQAGDIALNELRSAPGDRSIARWKSRTGRSLW